MSEKAIRLVEYLIRIAHLRSRIIRDFSEYERVMWLHQIPHEKGCYTRLWGSEEEHDPDIWIEVQTAKEPQLPTVPKVCRDWVIEESIHQTTDIPMLREEIAIQQPNPAWTQTSLEPAFITKTEKLVDHPEVRNVWETYVARMWRPWAEVHRKWETVHNIYSQLFTIYQEQKRLGEEYELVLSIGLLCWQTPQCQRVRRHLITAKASLEFEASVGRFTVRPAREGAQISVELDMLDIEEHPAGAERAAKEGLQAAHDDPWERAPIESVLKGLVHSVNPNGEYREVAELVNEPFTAKPIVYYTPALILRKRSIRGLTEILKHMKQDIEQGGRIPSEFADLAEMSSNSTDSQDEAINSSQSNIEDTEIYFPKPSNEEQKRIIEKFRTSTGVLVQGPPGTGKSHTIANLICHLLATGHRVLVTAKTPRALQVLEGLLPEEIRPLCVNLLGQGIEEKRSLEVSVTHILNKRDEWDREKLIRHGECEKIRTHLNELRREKAHLEKHIRSIRESETHTQIVADGAYRGTAAQIARAVRKNEPQFSWFLDPVSNDKNCPFEVQHLIRLLNILRKLTPERRQEFSRLIPNPNKDLPSLEDFKHAVATEFELTRNVETLSANADKNMLNLLHHANPDNVNKLCESIEILTTSAGKLQNNPEPWLKECVRDILSDNHSFWAPLRDVTLHTIEQYQKSVDVVGRVSIRVSDDIDKQEALQDARILKTHLESGGKLGWGIFRPKIVKERKYLLERIQIDGKKCRSLESLLAIVNYLEIETSLNKAWSFWQGRSQRKDEPWQLQIPKLQHLLNLLDQAFSLQNLLQRCKENLILCKIPEPIWHEKSQLEKTLVSCRCALLLLHKQSIATKIESWEKHLADLSMRSNAHPVVNVALKAIRARDVEGLNYAKVEIEKLEKAIQTVRWADLLLKQMEELLPRFVRSLSETCHESSWEQCLLQFPEAWRWAQAKTYLNDYINKDDLPGLERRVHQIENDIEHNISDLASFMAWSFCFKRMHEIHLRELVAWQQSIKRIGKGTGKHAPRFRREAQKHLNECVDVVPAWVMPLHRVWDTVHPAPEMFDTIIVDEASQCGPEALPLFYLGHKVIIVGDAKQISPDAVGLPRDAVHRLMEEFLHDFRFKDLFGVESSLFNHGELRYGTRKVALREHFRCMPEIIRFSNDLCYPATPLIPLRQYPPDRLTPLEHVFIQDGYRQGTYANVTNQPEAKVIVNRIVECCSDPKYSDKTMGVVVLQGEQQAKLIESLLLEQLGAAEMENRRLICGNPYSFQGGERDIMFLSMVAAPNEQIGVMGDASDERRFNVAASRAKDQMWLFHSVTRNDLSTKCLRRRLLEFFEETHGQSIAGMDVDALRNSAFHANRMIEKPPQPFDSWFEVDVALEIAGKGYRVIPQFKVAGKFIDLVIEDQQSRLAVECDGDEFHGADQYDRDMQRQRMLERCKWVFYRVRQSGFEMDREKALSSLWKLLEDRGIMPFSQKTVENQDQQGNSEFVKVGDTVQYINVQNPDNVLEALISKGGSSPDHGILNENTPVARALLGAQVGEEVQANLPTGAVILKVLKILKA